MIHTVKLQRQFTVLDIPACAVECGGVGTAFALAEYEICVSRSADPGGAGDHVHRIIVTHFSQVMDEQDGDMVFVR